VVTEDIIEGIKKLKESKMFETKVKLVVPLISLFGVKIEGDFDLKKFMGRLNEEVVKLQLENS